MDRTSLALLIVLAGLAIGLRFGRLGAGDLGQCAGAQVAHEDIAIAQERHAGAGGVDDRVLPVEIGARVVLDACRRATGQRLLPGIAHVAAVALERVVGRLAVPAPPGAPGDEDCRDVRGKWEHGRAWAAGGALEAIAPAEKGKLKPKTAKAAAAA